MPPHMPAIGVIRGGWSSNRLHSGSMKFALFELVAGAACADDTATAVRLTARIRVHIIDLPSAAMQKYQPRRDKTSRATVCIDPHPDTSIRYALGFKEQRSRS